ncbi:hypothetical protein ACFLXQ_04130 [Chloroflexota bacterium]
MTKVSHGLDEWITRLTIKNNKKAVGPNGRTPTAGWQHYKPTGEWSPPYLRVEIEA